MVKYKLYQLLKMKKKMANELKELTMKLNSYNSKLKGAEKPYHTPDVLKEIESLKIKMVILKKTILVATLPMYEEIYTIAEYKDTISTLKSMSTNDGLVEGRGYGDNTPQEYEATIKQNEVDEKVRLIETEIEKLQETIDSFNYTTEVELPW